MKMVLLMVFMIGCTTKAMKNRKPRPKSVELGMSIIQVERYFRSDPIAKSINKNGKTLIFEETKGFSDTYEHICKFNKEGKLISLDVRRQAPRSSGGGAFYINNNNLADQIAEPAMREQRIIEDMNQRAHEFNMMQQSKQQTCTSNPDMMGGFTTTCY
jgi:hypothetical protein